MGYKMAFRGRFSRKQRASFIWLHNGKVPLNTLKAHIDYSFFIVALKNSVVSIKVWFYLNKNCLNYKYILRI
jgi:ribosomal protein S3